MSHNIKVAEFQLTGGKAVVCIIALVCFMGYRVVGTHDATDNRELAQALRMEIESEITRATLPEIKQAMSERDKTRASALAAEITTSKVTFHHIYASEPILPIIGKEDICVKVIYSLANDPSREIVRYYNVERSGFTNWYVWSETSRTSYLLARL